MIANSWAARGAWDSALVAADRTARNNAGPVAGLHGYRLTAVGVWLGAVELLLALERDRHHFSNSHPYLTGVNRLTASNWLSAGDAAEATRLLTWHESIGDPGPQALHANALLAPFAYLARARILEAHGQWDGARAHYERFLSTYDVPVQAHQRLVAEARTALTRMTQP